MICAVIDWETTGLTMHPHAKINLQPRGIEWAAVKINSAGEELDSQTFLIDPGIEIEAVITKITGITNEHLQGKPKIEDLLPSINDFMRDVDVLCAHNLPFDHEILRLELERARFGKFNWPKHNLCTVQTYAEIWGRRPRLLELFEHVTGRPYLQTHRALDDVRALVEVVVSEKLVQLHEGISS